MSEKAALSCGVSQEPVLESAQFGLLVLRQIIKKKERNGFVISSVKSSLCNVEVVLNTSCLDCHVRRLVQRHKL